MKTLIRKLKFTQNLTVLTSIIMIIAFFLPWVDLSCNDKIDIITGFEFANGTFSEPITSIFDLLFALTIWLCLFLPLFVLIQYFFFSKRDKTYKFSESLALWITSLYQIVTLNILLGSDDSFYDYCKEVINLFNPYDTSAYLFGFRIVFFTSLLLFSQLSLILYCTYRAKYRNLYCSPLA